MAACGRPNYHLTATYRHPHCRLWAVPLPPVGGPTAACGRSHCRLWAVPLPPVGGSTVCPKRCYIAYECWLPWKDITMYSQ